MFPVNYIGEYKSEAEKGKYLFFSSDRPKTRALGRGPKTFTHSFLSKSHWCSEQVPSALPPQAPLSVSPLKDSFLSGNVGTPPAPPHLGQSFHASISPKRLWIALSLGSVLLSACPSAPGPSLSHWVAYHHLHSSHSCSKLGPLTCSSPPTPNISI